MPPLRSLAAMAALAFIASFTGCASEPDMPVTPQHVDGGVRLPATALMFRDEGMQVATVDAGNHVKLKTVVIARDMGAAVDVASGVSPTDRIIDNPADALQNGDEVRIANP